MSDSERMIEEDPRKKGSYLLQGKSVTIPPDWCFTPSGDPGLTRRLKKEAPSCFILVYRRKNRWQAKGLFCDSLTTEKVKKEWEKEKNSPAHIARLESSRKRREKEEKLYKLEFFYMVRNFLAFAPRYKVLAEELARLVADHACPVGSGTVARTKTISVEKRAEAALIAWMRHQTTSYDNMTIARVKGRRREVRRELASSSRIILERYRRGEDIPEDCPLYLALEKKRQESEENSSSSLA